jgi:hypothetical protein
MHLKITVNVYNGQLKRRDSVHRHLRTRLHAQFVTQHLQTPPPNPSPPNPTNWTKRHHPHSCPFTSNIPVVPLTPVRPNATNRRHSHPSRHSVPSRTHRTFASMECFPSFDLRDVPHIEFCEDASREFSGTLGTQFGVLKVIAEDVAGVFRAADDR